MTVSTDSPSAWHARLGARARILWPGLLLSAALASAAMLLDRIDWLRNHGLSALTLAIVLGMLVGNSIYPRLAARSDPGVIFSKQTLLRLGVILYGLRLTLQDIGEVGLTGVLIDTLVVGLTFLLACGVGMRLLGMDRKTVMLIGAGSSICGAAAVMATAPVVQARSEQVTVAVATVVIFGTVAIFLYPLLYTLNQDWAFFPGGTRAFGVYAGSTIHEVAQVVAAARSVDVLAADTAVIAKMVRVMMLAPFLILLSLWLVRSGEDQRDAAQPANAARTRVSVPWFALAFVAVVLFNSLQLLSAPVQALMTEIDTGILAMAMAALGLSTHASAMRKAGFKPVLLALILFIWLVGGGALINRWMTAWMGV